MERRDISPEEITKDLAQFQNMVYQRAHKTVQKYGVEWDEALSEATYGLIEAARTYDPEKATKSTWYYRVMFEVTTTNFSRHFKHCTRETTMPMHEMTEEDERSLIPEYKPSWLSCLLTELGEESRALVHIILDAPEDIADSLSPRAPTRSRNAVREYLIDVLDWPKDELNRSWQEVQSCL